MFFLNRRWLTHKWVTECSYELIKIHSIPATPLSHSSTPPPGPGYRKWSHRHFPLPFHHFVHRDHRIFLYIFRILITRGSSLTIVSSLRLSSAEKLLLKGAKNDPWSFCQFLALESYKQITSTFVALNGDDSAQKTGR